MSGILLHLQDIAGALMMLQHIKLFMGHYIIGMQQMQVIYILQDGMFRHMMNGIH